MSQIRAGTVYNKLLENKFLNMSKKRTGLQKVIARSEGIESFMVDLRRL